MSKKEDEQHQIDIALKEQAKKISTRYNKIKEKGKAFFNNADINFQLTAKTTALISIYPYMYNLKEFINEPPSIQQEKLDLTHILPIMSYLYQIYIFIEIIEKKAIKNGIFFELEDDLSFQDRIKKIYKDQPNFIEKIMYNLNFDLDELQEKINFMDKNFVQYFDEKLKSKIDSLIRKLGSIAIVNEESQNNEIESVVSPIFLKEIKSINDFLMEAKSINNEIEIVMNEMKKHDIEQTAKYNAYKKYLSFVTERIVSINAMIKNCQLYEETLKKIIEVDNYAINFNNIISQKLKEIQTNNDPWPFIAIINALYLTEPENLYDDKILILYDCQLKLLPFKELPNKKKSSDTNQKESSDTNQKESPDTNQKESPDTNQKESPDTNNKESSDNKGSIWNKMKKYLEERFQQNSIYEIMSILIKANIYNKPYEDTEIKKYNPNSDFDKQFGCFFQKVKK